jgi:putative NADH-flavin reductase
MKEEIFCDICSNLFHPMRILILGSTGRTGKHLLEQALQRGHIVTVLVRDKTRIVSKDSNLTVLEGSTLDKTVLANAMNGCEAILSALNISRNNDWPWAKLRSPKDFLSETMKLIVELAPKNNIRRIIFTSAWGVAETKKDIPGWFRWFIDHSNIGYPYLDHERQEDLLKQTSLQWTSVRAAGLTNGKKIKEILVSFNNKPKPRLTVNRRSVAAFMLDVLEKNLYAGQMPVISGK